MTLGSNLARSNLVDAVEVDELVHGIHGGDSVGHEGANQDRGVRVEVDEGHARAEAVGDGAGEHVVEEALEVGAELQDVQLQEVSFARADLVLVAGDEEDSYLHAGAAECPRADGAVLSEKEEAVNLGEDAVDDEE